MSDLEKNIEGAALTKAHAEGNTRRPDDSPSESELKLVPKAWHPELNTKGHKVPIDKPHQASDPVSWASGDQVALVTPGGTLPEQLNGIPFAPWADIPQTEGEWEDVDGQAELYEPPFHCPGHLGAAAGVIIKEQDGRVWIAAPTNGFGGSYVFPKGRTDGMSLQATAIKEAFEESGLQVAIISFIGDFNRTLTRTRYYLAKRVGGTPSKMGWESQAVLLVPLDQLSEYLTGTANASVLAALESS